jgi:hypothetical protein
MGHPSRQPAHGFHLLGLKELGLKLVFFHFSQLAFGDILQESQVITALPMLVSVTCSHSHCSRSCRSDRYMQSAISMEVDSSLSSKGLTNEAERLALFCPIHGFGIVNGQSGILPACCAGDGSLRRLQCRPSIPSGGCPSARHQVSGCAPFRRHPHPAPWFR